MSRLKRRDWQTLATECPPLHELRKFIRHLPKNTVREQDRAAILGELDCWGRWVLDRVAENRERFERHQQAERHLQYLLLVTDGIRREHSMSAAIGRSVEMPKLLFEPVRLVQLEGVRRLEWRLARLPDHLTEEAMHLLEETKIDVQRMVETFHAGARSTDALQNRVATLLQN